MFTPVKPRCPWGKVADAYVPAVTYCRLRLKGDHDNSRHDLGRYEGGFWVDGSAPGLPFLKQSWDGDYTSPQING